MSFNLTPPITVPLDAQNVSVSCISASLWNSTPNTFNKSITCELQFLDRPDIKYSYKTDPVSGGVVPLNPSDVNVRYTKVLSAPITKGLYDVQALNSAITRLLFQDLEFNDTDLKAMKSMADFLSPIFAHTAYGDDKVKFAFETILSSITISLSPVPGTNGLSIEASWDSSKFDDNTISTPDFKSTWLRYVDLSTMGYEPVIAAPDTPTKKFLMSSLLRCTRLVFKVNQDSVLSDLCGFTNDARLNMSYIAHVDSDVYTSIDAYGSAVPTFDKLQYYLLSCSLASRGVVVGGGAAANAVLARIHIPPGTGVYEQILYEPTNTNEFQTSGLQHTSSGLSRIVFTLLDQNGFPVHDTGDQSWSALIRISWS